MRLKPALLATALATALCACGGPRDDTDTPSRAVEEAVPVAEDPAGPAPPAAAADATAAPAPATGSLRVDAPAEGTLSFAGFGPARFGDGQEAVRQAWGGDLGDARPDAPGGCYYLIPQPMGTAGYRTAFMIEGDRFARVDVRDASVVAPGGARVGMTGAEVRALYPAVEEQPHKYDPEGKVLRVRDPAGGNGVLVLELDAAGKVDAWRIGVPPQVDYVEGCS